MSENVQYCLICKHSQKTEEKQRAAVKEVMYLHSGAPYSLHFCYLHSIEYFLKGQAGFLTKYNAIIEQFCQQTDDPVQEYIQKLEASLILRRKSRWWKGDWFAD